MQHLLSPSTPPSYICCMVHVIVPQGGGQYSQLTPFSLTVIWPARCVTITPAGNVGEKERQKDREREKGTKRQLSRSH